MDKFSVENVNVYRFYCPKEQFHAFSWNQLVRTASTAEQPSIGPAQSSKVHSEVHSFVSKERVKCRQDRRERGKEGEIEEGKEGTY